MDSQTDKPPLIILGAGDYNQRYVRLFTDVYDTPAPPYRLAGFAQNADDNLQGEKLDGYPVYSLSEMKSLAATHYAHSSMGDCDAKRHFVEQVASMGFRFASLMNLGAVSLPEPPCHYRGTSEI